MNQSTDIVSSYLAITASIIIFGVGFPYLLLQYPAWLRRIRRKYSIFEGSHQLITVIIILLFVVLLEYEFEPIKFYYTTNFAENHFALWLVINVFLLIFLFFTAVSVLIFSAITRDKLLPTYYLYEDNEKKESNSPLIKRHRHLCLVAYVFLNLFFLLVLIGETGLAWHISGEILSSLWTHFHSSPLVTLKNNPAKISNTIVFIGLVSIIILWIRYYYYQFPLLLERITSVATCFLHKEKTCWHYHLLRFKKNPNKLFVGSGNASTQEKARDTFKQFLLNPIEDLGIMGANAESEGDVMAVLRSLKHIVGRLENEEVATIIFKEQHHEITKDLIRGISNSLIKTLTNQNIRAPEPLLKSMEIITQLVAISSKFPEHTSENNQIDISAQNIMPSFDSHIASSFDTLQNIQKTIGTNDNDQKVESHSAATRYLKEIGGLLIKRINDNRSEELAEELKKGYMMISSAERKSEILFYFGLAGYRENKFLIWSRMVDELRRGCEQVASEPNDTTLSPCHYYVALLAHIATANRAAKDWILNKELKSGKITSEDIDQVQKYFAVEVGDFETATKLMEFQELLEVEGNSISVSAKT